MNQIVRFLGACGRFSAPLCIAAMVLGSSADAAVITAYTDLASWNAAAGAPVAVEDFTDTTLVPGLSVNPAGGGAISGGKLSGSLAVFGLCVGGGTGCPATTQFGFSPSTTAFAADWDLTPGGAGSGIFFDVVLVGGAIQRVNGFTNPAGGIFSGFYGFVSDTAFTSINLGSGFTGNGELFDADNVRFRTIGTTSVPEPESLSLVALAMLAAFSVTRRRRK